VDMTVLQVEDMPRTRDWTAGFGAGLAPSPGPLFEALQIALRL
jgi:hypothetical protein